MKNQTQRLINHRARRHRRGEAMVWVVSAVLLLSVMALSLLYVQRRIRRLGSRPVVAQLNGPTGTLDLGNGVKLELIRIPAGEFVMGSPDEEPDHDISESPQHKVVIGRPFYMGKFEVTQNQWGVIRQASSRANIGPLFPADGVSWTDATRWCEEMSKRLKVQVRLPTEAEWEYACRAGTTTAYAFGPKLSAKDASFNSSDEARKRKTMPVGSFKPNAWGLYDMHGNVWEWCQDTLQGDYENAPKTDAAWIDPQTPYNRVRRGGSWADDAANLRSAVRWGAAASEKEPELRNDQVGFRVVVDVPNTK
jgi:formylglycine-generating enzyme required for sulfatase activity